MKGSRNPGVNKATYIFRMFQNACRMFLNACRMFKNTCRMFKNAYRKFNKVNKLACNYISLHAVT